MSGFDLGDLLGDVFPGTGKQHKPGSYEALQDQMDKTKRAAEKLPTTPKKSEKGVPWEAKVLDGKYYVPLSQVADLLEANGVLPGVSKGIRKRTDV